MRLLILLFLFSFTVSLSAETTPTAMEERLAAFLKKFPEADLNKDGKLVKEEVAAFRQDQKASGKAERKRNKPQRLAPTFANVSYGEHERQKFDIWLPNAESETPFPILIFFHGGGFVAGDKSGFAPDTYLEAGIACASANYRFVDGKTSLSDVPLSDATRVIQTIRHRAGEFRIDSGRVALSGSSAGAVITLWLGYHDDLADPDSEDPIARESTRVNAVIPINGPTNLMPEWILENIGGGKSVHGSYVKMFGAPADISLTPAVEARIRNMSAWEQVSEDDPPTLLIYSGDLSDHLPLPESATTGKVIHHPFFGKALKERLDTSGVENELLTGFDPRGSTKPAVFLMNHFSMLE